MVPPDASLGIGEAEMTHVSHLKLKGLHDSLDVDWIIYSPGSNGDRALTNGEFDKITERPGGLMLLKRKPKAAMPAPGAPTQPILTAPPAPPPAPPR